MLDLFREALGSRVKEVRASKRLTDSPCCLVNADGLMQRRCSGILEMSGKDVPPSSRVLEVNPDSPLIGRLATARAPTPITTPSSRSAPSSSGPAR